MQLSGCALELSASDLSQFLSCRHLTALNVAVALGRRAAPAWVDPVLEVLQQRGLDHERSYVGALRTEGLTVLDLTARQGQDAVSRSLDGMREGCDVIVQPALRSGRWFGRPDLLRRREIPSALGPWSYEVYDTKLAKETRGGTILQLALYSELLGLVQELAPEAFHVVTPDPTRPVQTFLLRDYAAYFRLIRSRLQTAALEDPALLAAANYPEPVAYCDNCRWRSDCDRRRRDDDHLSLVAGISRLQCRELQSAAVSTLAQLGRLALPLPFASRRGAAETYVRVREQARVQLEGRLRGAPVHELLPVEPDQGLARLPAPSAGDVFLDLEGDPFARDGGREYLFGLAILGADGTAAYRSRWAFSDAEERAAFETVVDDITQTWEANPGMHVYHYAPYEPAAFKRLMGRHATREAAVDRMLRAGLFVDLYAVVRHALRASVERYSIKDLEPFYTFLRSIDLADARTGLRVIERALELGDSAAVTGVVRAAVESYNQDDCLSALALRSWLERLRSAVKLSGTPVPRPAPKDGAPPEKVDDRARRVQALFAALTAGLSADRADRDAEQQANWLLAHLLDFHRREDKAPWWEFFRLRDLTEEELLAEKAALSGLRFAGRIGGTAKCPIDRYRYPFQDTEVREGDSLHLPDGTDFGEVERIDRAARTVEIKKRAKQAEAHPAALFAHTMINADVLAEALLRIGDDVLRHGISCGAGYRAARELLLGRPPRLRTGEFRARPGESAVEFAVRIAPELDRTVLAIQGPPGAGKTYTGARMICELVRRGARVGVTAVSHKVIRNLLDAALREADKQAVAIRCVHKVKSKDHAASAVEQLTDNGEVLDRLQDGRANLAGGTAWLWARPEAREACDVLFVDEAGQMSLANVLAASQGAASVVLLGDPQQLEQPQQGSHPEGSDVSGLEHILQGRKTIPEDRGIFLPETWRLAPSICAFTSEVFYEEKLRARAGLEKQALAGTAPFEGAGLWVVPVDHEGNQNSSIEEVEAIDGILDRLLRPGARWIDRDGNARELAPEDVLIIAPYNSQVSLLAETLGARARIGTVDKFQGQEAPVAIYSMATSRPEDAPRGMEFLYSLNRLNVATSRARCASILVASPRLFEPECKSPRQMQLANALCRYVELARPVVLA
jgi:predicted RecB family nuclease